jgi:hypothetical protein
MTTQKIISMLKHLNDLYYPPDGATLSQDDLAGYYEVLDNYRRIVSEAFPGLTLVLAEVQEPVYAPAMTHVLAPIPEGETNEKRE